MFGCFFIWYKIGEKILIIDADICSTIKKGKNYNIPRGSYISLSWFSCGSSILITLEFGDTLVFVEGEQPSEQGKNQQDIIERGALLQTKILPFFEPVDTICSYIILFCCISTYWYVYLKCPCDKKINSFFLHSLKVCLLNT